MKSVIKTTVAGLVLSTVTVSVAVAMIPQIGLITTLLPDEGISSQLLSDVDNGAFKSRTDVTVTGSDLSKLRYKPEPITQYHRQLAGKHLI